ncbi:MAG: hypothetical protein JW795_08395, partial [Chitinivibrionales bacterium]|nr:hypothetical protein [Chitinivibrionales bacterium]
MRRKVSNLLKIIPFAVTSIFLLSSSAQQVWKPAAGLLQDGDKKVMVSVIQNRTDEIVLQYAMPEPTFTPFEFQRVNGVATTYCAMGNAQEVTKEGEPIVPLVVCNAILPAGKTVKDISVELDDIVTVPQPITLSYGGKPLPLSAEVITYAEP